MARPMGDQKSGRCMLERIPDEEIQTLFEFSQYQDALFEQIVDAVEDVRLSLGWAPTTFYGPLGMNSTKIKHWMRRDIHKFFLSDIAYIAYKAGLKISFSFAAEFSGPIITNEEFKAKKRRRKLV